MSTISQNDLYTQIIEANARGERVVVATVARTRGSTPQQRGAKMLFFENGEARGTVGGGCIEAEVWAEAREAIRSGKSALHHFSLTAEEASEEGMVCGGTMDIFLDVIEISGCRLMEALTCLNHSSKATKSKHQHPFNKLSAQHRDSDDRGFAAFVLL